MRRRFERLSRWASEAAGSWQAFALAFATIVTWTLGGFHFGFANEVYQLVINTITTICSFLMVFLIQGSQNRDSKALQAKIDGLVRAVREADDRLIDLEHQDDDRIAEVRAAVSGTGAADPGGGAK